MVEEKMNIYIYLIPIYLLLTFLVIVFVHWLITRKPLFSPLYVDTLPDVNKNHIENLTRVGNTFFRFMNQNKFPYVVIAGSLLGIIRHSGNIIPWDDDIDVAIPEERKTEIIKKLRAEFGDQIQEHSPGLYRFIVDDTLWVDIFIMKRVLNKYLYFHDPDNFLWPNEWLHANVFQPSGKLTKTFCDNKVFIPKDYTEYLDRSYPGWSKQACVGLQHSQGLKGLSVMIFGMSIANICKKLQK